MHLRTASLGTLLVLSAAFSASHVLTVNKAMAAGKAEKPVKQFEPLVQDAPLGTPKDAPKALSLACAGPFARDTTHAKLTTEFGAKNVAFMDVTLSSNVLTKASVIFDDDPTRRVVVYWKDNKTRSKPMTISVERCRPASPPWSSPSIAK